MAIDRNKIFVTSGDRNAPLRAFFNNEHVFINDGNVVPFSYQIPTYTTNGGTTNYYSQDAQSIFTNLSAPFIRFKFCGGTESLSGDSYIEHKIYRVEYDVFKLYSLNQIDNKFDTNNQVEDDKNNSVGSSDNKFKRVNSFNYSRKGGGEYEVRQPSGYITGDGLGTSDMEYFQSKLSEPIVVLTTSTSSITSNIYDFQISQYVKNLGSFKTDLFLDKAQYFVETTFNFKYNVPNSDLEFFAIDPDNKVYSSSVPTYLFFKSSSPEHTIQTGEFNGLTVKGNFFSYFVVPDKPKLEYPIPEGQLTTFSPQFVWSNGEDADEYLVQITYTTGNTGFTGSVFNYPVTKDEAELQDARSTTKGGTEEFSTNKAIRKYQVPLKSNKCFRWRLANVKQIVNIFGVKQFVATFSDSYVACTQPEAVKLFVKVQSDSPYVSEISEFLEPPSLESESPVEEYMLSGVVSGSVVNMASMTLIYPNSSFVNTTTDAYGYYYFTGLEAGTYTLITNYRGYQQDTRVININSDTVENFKLKLLWGNNVDTWGDLGGENYYV